MQRNYTTRTSSRVAYRPRRNVVGNKLGIPLVLLGIVWLVLVVHLAGTWIDPASTLVLAG